MSLGSVKIMILPIILVFGVMNERKLDTTPQDFDDPCLTISDTHQYKMSNNIHQWNSSIKFVVFGSARTGSNYLFELLRRHPLIVVYYEIFNQFVEFNYTEPYPNIKISERAIRSRHKDPEKFLNCIWNTNNDNRTAVGFKIFPGHLMNPIVDELLLHDKTIKKMVLIRSDVLAVYASVVFARTSGTWLLSDTSKMNFTLNIADFIVFEKEYVGCSAISVARSYIELPVTDFVSTYVNHTHFLYRFAWEGWDSSGTAVGSADDRVMLVAF
eukprot:gene4214-8388_t